MLWPHCSSCSAMTMGIESCLYCSSTIKQKYILGAALDAWPLEWCDRPGWLSDQCANLGLRSSGMAPSLHAMAHGLSLPSDNRKKLGDLGAFGQEGVSTALGCRFAIGFPIDDGHHDDLGLRHVGLEDRKSTRLNSSHLVISYAVFCLKKKKYKNICSIAY